MAQITHGIRSILSHPAMYNLSQNVMGAGRSRRRLVRDHIKPDPGSRILDIGCGTAELLPFLPADIEYVGFDLSQPYIDAARRRFGDRGRFECMDITDFEQSGIESGADIAIAIGILHHLDDDLAQSLIRTAWSKLKPGGRFISLDGTLTTTQSRLARDLILRDRGQNIREPAAYESLAKAVFPQVKLSIREDMLYIPYTHCILECTK